MLLSRSFVLRFDDRYEIGSVCRRVKFHLCRRATFDTRFTFIDTYYLVEAKRAERFRTPSRSSARRGKQPH